MKLALLTFLLAFSNATFAQDYRLQMTVAKDGTGDFDRIQAAIDASKAFPDKRIEINVKNGIYKEKVEVYAWNPRLSLIGESREGTIITFGDHFRKMQKGRNSTFHSYTLRIRGNDFHAENITVINSSGPVGQAVALHIEADRVSIVNSTVKGYQDTLYLAGEGFRSYFRDCQIEGSVDFIFGEGTALFENCEIRSVADGYITAASTPQGVQFGLVFKNCKLTAADGVSRVYLGRPWRQFARTVFMYSELGAHILPPGWDDWGREANRDSAFYAEFANTGPGAKTGSRVAWSEQLTEETARQYTQDTVLRGWEPDESRH